MTSEIEKVVFNGELVRDSILDGLVRSLSDPDIITEKGGYIFKSLLKDRCLNLGFLPYFIEGERTHHYDIDLGDSKFNLIGFINSARSMTLIFKLTQEEYRRGLSDEDRQTFRKHYILLAEFLVRHGFDSEFEFDGISRGMLRESNIILEEPKSIGALAAIPLELPGDAYTPLG